ncbi:MAG: hypothetical protein IJE80_01910 [Peptococcaceae bacterium]|nr:hypothetical protein [Peptococcaceae bacterium]MBQ2905737.1 hypothetical protein [Peptococcaceae bacterium]MBQ3120186.1 hypothetical protein [Peptococcaceae bacterium]MBQ3205912.1 hypothetical protein [Peptococcaceae bacterium]
MRAMISNKTKQNTVPSLRQQSPQKTLPAKRTINLAAVGEHKIAVKWAALGIVLIITAAVLFGKVAVADRFAALAEAEHQAAAVRAQLEEGYAQIEAYGALAEEYAHYTYSGMTEEELNRVNRVDAIALINRIVLPKAVVNSWTIQGNEMSLIIGDNTLQNINLIVQALEKDELVDFCIVTNAATEETLRSSSLSGSTTERVTAKITVYLNSGMGEVK